MSALRATLVVLSTLMLGIVIFSGVNLVLSPKHSAEDQNMGVVLIGAPLIILAALWWPERPSPPWRFGSITLTRVLTLMINGLVLSGSLLLFVVRSFNDDGYRRDFSIDPLVFSGAAFFVAIPGFLLALTPGAPSTFSLFRAWLNRRTLEEQVKAKRLQQESDR